MSSCSLRSCGSLDYVRFHAVLYYSNLVVSVHISGPTLPMATVDIKSPEISNAQRFHNSQVNNIVHSSFQKREKKGKAKKKRLTKADIGTPSNFQ